MSAEIKSRDEVLAHYRSLGFQTGDSCCLACGHTFDSAVEPGTKLTKLQCPKCNEQRSLFYEHEPTTQPEK